MLAARCVGGRGVATRGRRAKQQRSHRIRPPIAARATRPRFPLSLSPSLAPRPRPPAPPGRRAVAAKYTPNLPPSVVDGVRASVEAADLADHSTQGAHGAAYHHQQPTGGYAFYMPPVSFMGAGALQAAGAHVRGLGLRKALIVTDAPLVAAGAVAAVTAMLESVGVAHAVYAGVEPNPTVGQVEAGLALLRAEECDCVVSFGGGSPHDAAKGIAAVATSGGSIRDYEGLDKLTAPMLPLIACNTTAGTASELTRFAIITDPDRKVKLAIIDWRVTPTVAVNDPVLMKGMPRGLTAATGMDALTHAIEAYVSTSSTPVTDACALQAIKLVSQYLRRAVNTPDDMEARDMMAYAEYLAGMAFNSAGLGYVHAMAHQLGGFYNLPHGVCNAVLLPHVQAFNAAAVPHLLRDVGVAMGATAPADDDAAAVDATLAAIKTLAADVGIPRNLAELGVRTDDLGTLAANAMKDACGATNPRAPSAEEVVAIFLAACKA